VDIVLGVSMTPSAVRMVLVEGENADGASVDHEAFEANPDVTPAMSGAHQKVLDAILGTQESAAAGGHRLTSVGVAWTDHSDAARLRQCLRQHQLHDVVLVSDLHAASALAQAIGQTVGCQRTALLLIERDTATLAVVRTGDGAVIRVISRSLDLGDSSAELQAMVAGLAGGRRLTRPALLAVTVPDSHAVLTGFEAIAPLPTCLNRSDRVAGKVSPKLRGHYRAVHDLRLRSLDGGPGRIRT
jgi:hypothetical protein